MTSRTQILNQPLAIRNLLKTIEPAKITEIALEILRAQQLVLVGGGNSRHSAIIGRYILSRISGKLSEVIMSSEFHHFADSVDRKTLVIAVSSQGIEIGDTITGVRKARECGATIFSITDNITSPLANISSQVIPCGTPPINKLIIFYLLAFATLNRLSETIDQIKRISFLIQRNIQHIEPCIKDVAKKLQNKSSIYYLGRGINFAIAGESALKMKQIAHIHAEGMPAGELKHGTLAVIEKGTPVIGICPNDYTYNEMLNNLSEVKARKGYVIGISDKNNDIFDDFIPIPIVDQIFYPLVSVIQPQLLAYYISRGENE